MNKKLSFEKKIGLAIMALSAVILLFSYAIFIMDKLSVIDENIRLNLKNVAFEISQDSEVKKKLYLKDNDNSIQEYAKLLIDNIEDVDLIVIGDMEGRKYSHLDESQIGKVYVNPDNKEVIEEGKSYYSLMEGSMGKTLRWFQPIIYKNEQVGFVMVGKYYKDILKVSSKTAGVYMLLAIFTFFFSILSAKILAKSIRSAILGMEPEEIVSLYNQKKIIINSVSEGIMFLDKENNVIEINNRCYDLIEDFSHEKVIDRLKFYIDRKESFDMKELIIQGKKIFVTLKTMYKGDKYLGILITLSDKENISKIAKEITGIDEVIKDLRANVHEFKNNMHVILGLIKLGEYSEAEKYILKIQNIQKNNINEFSNIKDYYVRALLLSRKLVAKERNIKFNLNIDSSLDNSHQIIDSQDIVTILGNLVENAFEACAQSDKENKYVEVYIKEDVYNIELVVKDNGIHIDKEIKNNMFIRGVSSKGNNRGIGLDLVKNKVELYNGDINVVEENDEKIFKIIILKGE